MTIVDFSKVEMLEPGLGLWRGPDGLYLFSGIDHRFKLSEELYSYLHEYEDVVTIPVMRQAADGRWRDRVLIRLSRAGYARLCNHVPVAKETDLLDRTR